MQYGIRLEQTIEKVGEHFSVVAWEQQPQCVAVSRARSQAVPSKAHHLTSPPHAIVLLSSIQMVNCQYRMSVC